MRPRRIRVLLGYMFVALLGLVNGGCVAMLVGGAVAGGAAGYAYYKGNVSQDVNADFEQTWTATYSALADLGMPVVHFHRDHNRGDLESRTKDGERVRIYLDDAPTTNRIVLTRVHVRIGIFGNYELSERIHNQIALRLKNPAPAASQATGMSIASPGVAPAPGAIKPTSAVTQQTVPPPVAATETAPPPTLSGAVQPASGSLQKTPSAPVTGSPIPPAQPLPKAR